MGRPKKQPEFQAKNKPAPLAKNKPSSGYRESGVYTCSSCGNEYLNQDANFIQTASPYYAGNNQHLTMCNKCVEHFAEQYYDILHDPVEAVNRVCMHLDLYYDKSIFPKNVEENSKKTVREYLNLVIGLQEEMKTYDDYLDEKNNAIVGSGQFESMIDPDDIEVTKKQLDMWGTGFHPEEYQMLDDHYKYLATQRSSDDPVQDIYIRDMCEIKVLQARALKNGKMDDWAKYKKLYQDTAKNAKLNPASQKDTMLSDNDSWGMFISNIERYTPAEYYKNKKLFTDSFDIGKYCERFILRPLRNLVSGSKDLDDVYNVEDETDGGDVK